MEGITFTHGSILDDKLALEKLREYATLDSPNFSGIPTAPTANEGTSTNQVATTEFVSTAVDNKLSVSSSGQTTQLVQNGVDVTSSVVDALQLENKAPLDSPNFSGTPTAPTAASGTRNSQLATTEFVQQELRTVVPQTDSTPTQDSTNFLTSGTIYSYLPHKIPATLAASGWNTTTLSQTLSVSGVSSDESSQMVQVMPYVSSQNSYFYYGIVCSNQSTNSLTFTCEEIPSSDINIYVIIQNIL